MWLLWTVIDVSGQPAADQAAVTRMARGDHDALAEVYDRHGRLVYSLALRILKDQSDAEDIVPIDEQVAWAGRAAVVRGALDALPLLQRIAIELAFYEGLTHLEIAERLEVPLGTVKTRIRQGLLKLKDRRCAGTSVRARAAARHGQNVQRRMACGRRPAGDRRRTRRVCRDLARASWRAGAAAR
jgi:Sigma-70, region 4/Sigma-70 region 2